MAQYGNRDTQKQAFERLLNIMDDLREQCPWDKKQTLESLRYLTIEETYELSDAILEKDYDEIKKEIGDLILHMVFYTRIASENQKFTIEEVLNGLCEKLIRRHPHIYGDPDNNHEKTDAKDEEAVKQNWEQIKLKEKGSKKTVLGGVPQSLPPLVKAMRIQEKVQGVGFDWENKAQVWNKVEEEMQEFKQEHDEGKPEAADEFGDLLFSMVNFARFAGINPEEALARTNKKFLERFNKMEARVNEEGKHLSDMSISEMEAYWQKAKNE